ncbi:hypothetical protein E2562_029317 [Oryza meyeriana var. granulata]|uniref:Calcium uniporter protein C-terminal domain-containing protein n=1 Tax=Oryza meyeriana var. granulata TaxID=110450 RepID=A0A6G1E3K0_9ORYZ|nr:hypothetical protein E2562_029317 [Oryza meyeriana var. granulata]
MAHRGTRRTGGRDCRCCRRRGVVAVAYGATGDWRVATPGLSIPFCSDLLLRRTAQAPSPAAATGAACTLRHRDEVIGYGELLDACVEAGAPRTRCEAEALARAMDKAGGVLLFGDKAYLHPEKIMFQKKEELKQLQERKEEIDRLVHKQVRRILWSGLGFFMCRVGLFFRLIYWEFSWDVMEPIAFFTTASCLLVGYAYFLITSRDPTYQDFMERSIASVLWKVIILMVLCFMTCNTRIGISLPLLLNG